MAATSQPIALPVSTNHDPNSDVSMGSYSGTNGSFNPVSYTRQYLGSPLSWRTGSFGSRMHPGSSPGQLFSQFDPNDFKCGKMSSSIESDRGSTINALNVFDRQEDLCRNYACCGLDLPDLHALVEHFEETHVVVVDSYAPHVPYPNPNTVPHPLPSHNPGTTPTQAEPHSLQQTKSYFPEAEPKPQQHVYQSGPVDPDDMELDSITSHSTPSSGAPSPPDTPITTPLSAYPSAALVCSYSSSQPPSPPSSTSSFESHILAQYDNAVAAFDTTAILPQHNGITMSKPHTHLSSAFTRASSRDSFSSAGSRELTPDMATYPFNAYAGYSDWSSRMPGTVPSPPSSAAAEEAQNNTHSSGDEGSCVPPALLFSTSTTPANTPSTSRVSSPAPPQQAKPSTTLSRPASTLLLSKPFKCPNAKCNKSYKQANGLKYHVTHGSCSLKPVREVEAVRVLLASKSNAANSNNNSGSNSPNTSSPNSPNPNSPSNMDGQGDYGLTQEELMAIEKRVRPFACGVGECQRRYKNMNGLRYHYAHSGDHGKQGLEMLAKGVHECLVNGRQGGSRPTTPPSQTTFDSQRELPVQRTSQFQNATPITLQHVETQSMDPIFHAQPGYVQSQPYHQMPYQPFQQQSYTLAGAMGGLGVYGQQGKKSVAGV